MMANTPFLLLALLVAPTQTSHYDPHLPRGSPWFEGWYTRISQASSGHSIGIIVGHYPDKVSLQHPRIYVALILDDGKGGVKTYEAFPDEATVHVNGGSITQDPDFDSEPNFTFSIDGVIKLWQKGSLQLLEVALAEQGVTLEARITEPEPWASNGEGPEGWASKVPFLGLHWFVYSLHSKVSYNLTTPELGRVSGQGSAHQEKNWGTAFPSSWIWGEAIEDKPGNLRLAFAGGPAPVGPVTLPNAYLVGFRSEKLDWNFHPQDPALFYPRIEACRGRLELTAASANRLLKITVQADPAPGKGFFNVGGPTMEGFKADSVESYLANIKVEAYSGPLHDHLEEVVEFRTGAIEFGGGYRCPDTPNEIEKTDTKRRVRRELRSLSAEEREKVFAAVDVMKLTSTKAGQHKYGRNFVSYDELVAQHLANAASPGCDEAHLGVAFATYHRAFLLRFELSLLAVDPDIGAMPYWDYNVEAKMAEPRKSEIWKWFGSSEGDPNDGHAVKDGRFAHWRIRANASEISNYSNSYNLLRSPWNANPSRHITRHRYSCGSETSFDARIWKLCAEAPDFLAWYACVDPTVHTWAHSFLGGVWHTERNVSRVECFLTNAIGIPAAWGKGCLECSSNCTDPNAAQKTCRCQRSNKMGCIATKPLAKQAPTYGDFADAWTSPNDPIFFFHHANVDRNLMEWQQRHRSQAPHYSFPKASLPCKGHGLHDISGPSWPFEGLLLGLDGPLTNADLIAVDGFTGPYTYDSLVLLPSTNLVSSASFAPLKPSNLGVAVAGIITSCVLMTWLAQRKLTGPREVASSSDRPLDTPCTVELGDVKASREAEETSTP
eukprot:TRINITY_DN36160_c0_g1_i1.p1 TRINITY_DN36160_c0_g1~~TRINITY_DN36160_c0_g1_i1.p1  ORF type:complete len:841 (-),score=136.83 TRINITY_DN36160_c0_g1_i1:23-2524(-)